MKLFFLILLIAVILFISIKPHEGFDASYNKIHKRHNEIELFSNANIAIFTIAFVLFTVMLFLIIKLRT